MVNGERLIVRTIRPNDTAALIRMHERLSTDSIYRRYFGARPVLSGKDAHRFTHLLEVGRGALVAETAAGELVAVSRYEGSATSDAAEIAAIVQDTYQGHGLGRTMLAGLVELARSAGLKYLVADVLEENRPMLGLLRSLGLQVVSTVRDASVITITLALDPATGARSG